MSFPLIPAIALFLTLALTIYKCLVHPLFISPLSHVPPAHWSSPISPLWIILIRFRSLENRTLHAAHLKLGPIIRLGPNEISVNDLDGLRTVYGGGFEKGHWYSVFDNYGVPNMFSTAHTRAHSTRKRMLSNIYSKSTIQTSTAIHHQSHTLLFTRLLPLLSSSSSKTAINIHEIWFATTMDSITAYLFGLASSTNFLHDEIYRKHWLKLYYARRTYPFFPQEMPFLTNLLKRVGVRLVPRFVEAANLELEEWCLGLSRKTFQYLKQVEREGEGERDPGNEPVVLAAMMSGIAKEEKLKGEESVLSGNLLKQKELGIASEMLDHLAAGYETSGITLTYLTYQLSRNLPLQALLREELLSLGAGLLLSPTTATTSTITNSINPTNNTLPHPKTLDALPLLHAILSETLRLHAAIPGNQPRVSPFPSCTIGSYEIPGGTVVGAQGYSVHRNENIFEQAEVWDYTRWLGGNDGKEEGESRMKERERNMWAFGSGGRMCVGSHFAVHEIKLITAAIYTNFTTHIDDDTGIEQEDGYVAGPVGNRLMMRFERVEGVL